MTWLAVLYICGPISVCNADTALETKSARIEAATEHDCLNQAFGIFGLHEQFKTNTATTLKCIKQDTPS